MPDITMCHGRTCSGADRCHRCTAMPSAYRQSYFAEEPDKDCLAYFKNNDLTLAIMVCRYFDTNRKYLGDFIKIEALPKVEYAPKKKRTKLTAAGVRGR